MRWPEGFHCPRCQAPDHDVLGQGSLRLHQCKACRHPASLTTGTVTDSSKLPPRTWFLALYLTRQAKTGLSSPALMRQPGTSYRTAWLVHHKLMAAMAQCEASDRLVGAVQLDDACLGGERLGLGGQGSPNKVRLVATVSTNDQGHALRMKLAAITTFSREAVATCAKANLLAGCDVRSDGPCR